MRVPELFAFIQERHAIYTRRLEGLPKPWTQDPILQNYRFCNVYRENDTVTRWIARNWRDPNTDDSNVWFAMAVARFVNWPASLDEVGYPAPWMSEHFSTRLLSRAALGLKVFTGAYIVHAGRGSKVTHVADKILTPLWEKRDYVRESTTSLARFHKRLMEFNGVGSFMAGQIVCDTKYTRMLDTALDWWTWACSGPGSQRGLNRILDRPFTQAWDESEWYSNMLQLHSQIAPLIIEKGMPPIHMQDLQNCLCEFDKYERARLGQGRPRNNYPGE